MEFEEDYGFNEDIVNIETKVITKKQTPETDEALMLLEMAKKKIKQKYLIPFFVFLVVGIGFCFTPGYMKLIGAGCGIVAIICLISYFVYRSIILNPYYTLLNIAIQNDEIRHEERIRFRERKRLENEEENKIELVKETTLQVEPKRLIIPKERPTAPITLLKDKGE